MSPYRINRKRMRKKKESSTSIFNQAKEYADGMMTAVERVVESMGLLYEFTDGACNEMTIQTTESNIAKDILNAIQEETGLSSDIIRYLIDATYSPFSQRVFIRLKRK